MIKVRVKAWVYVDVFLAPIENDYGQTEYVIESAVPVRQELMDDITADLLNELHGAVDAEMLDDDEHGLTYQQWGA
jgi:hypothetical protein